MPAETIIQLRRGTTSEWNLANPVLEDGEQGYDTSIKKFKIGNGVDDWSTLVYLDVSPQLIEVCLSGTRDFTSLKSAVDSITDASEIKPYIIKIFPGAYTESPFTCKKYVSISGNGSYYNTIVKTNNNNAHFITGNAWSDIRGFAIEGPTGVGFAAIYYGNVAVADKSYPFIVSDIAIRKGYYGVYCYSAGTPYDRTKIHCMNVVNYFGTADPVNVMFRSEGKANITCIGCAVMSGRAGTSSAVNVGFQLISDAANLAEMTLDLCSSLVANTGIEIIGLAGKVAYLRTSSCSITGGTTGISSVYGLVESAGTTISNGVTGTHINIDGNSVVSYSGVADKNKIVVGTGGKLAATFSDDTVGEEGQVIFGELWLGNNKATSIPLKDYGISTYSTGWVTGGVVTKNVTPLDIDISAGHGFVNDGLGVYRVNWNATTLTVPASTPLQFIYVTSSGVVSVSTTEPNYESNILLAVVDTDTTDTVVISDHTVPLDFHISRMAEYLEEVIGAISLAGGNVSINGTGVNVTGGEYYRIFKEINFVGGTSVTFTPISRGTTTPNYGTDTNVVPLTQYDSAPNTLTTIPTGKFVKHTLWVTVNANGDEYYSLVYGQELFDSSALALAGGLPIAPETLVRNSLRLASIIIEESTQITTIKDERPKLGQMASASTAISNHNDLSGRDSDTAHIQYAKKADGVVQQINAINSTNGTSVYSSGTFNLIGSGMVDIRYNGNSVIINAEPNTIQYVAGLNGQTGSIQLIGQDNVTVSVDGKSIYLKGKTDFPFVNTSQSSVLQHTSGMSNYQTTGNYLTTAAQSNHSHSVVVQGNLLATQGSGTYTLSVPNQTVQTQGSVALNGNTGALSLAVGSSLSSSVNGSSSTFGLASNITTALQSAGNYLTTAAQSNHSHSVVVQGNLLATQGSGTYTLSVPNQTVQTQGMVSLNGNTGALSLAVGSSLSSGVNGNSTTFGLASNITTALQSAGAYLTTAAQSNHSHSVVVQGNLLATQGSGTYTLSVPNQTVQTQGSVVVNGNSGALSFAVGSSLSSSVNGNSTTFGLASNITTALQSAGNYLTTAMLSNASSNFVNTSQSSLFQSTGNYLTTAAASDHIHGFTGANVSGTFNTNGLSLSVDPAGGAGDGYNIIAAGGSTATSVGTIVFSNSNGIGFGLNGNTVTASHNGLTNAGAFLASNVSSNYQHTSGMSDYQTAGAYLTTAALSNHGHSIAVQGNILATSGNGTFTLSVPTQTVQTQGMVSLNGNTGALSLAVGSSLSVFANGNSSTFGLASNITTALQSAGAYLTTAAVSNHSHSIVVQGNLLVTQGNNTITISAPAQTVQTQGMVSLNGNTGALSLGVGSSLSVSVNGVSSTFGLASNITTALQSAGAYLTTAANSTHSHGNPTLALTGLNGTTASNSNGLTLSLSAAGGGVSTGTLSAVGNTIDANSVSATWNVSNLQFSGAGIASVGVSNGSVVVSVPAGGGAGDGVNIVQMGTTGTTGTAWSSLSGTVQLNGYGGIIVSQNNSNQINIGYTGTDIERMIIANTSGGTTGTVSGAADVYLYGGNNVTLSQNQNSVTVNGAAGGAAALTYLTYQNRQLGASTYTTMTNNQIWMIPFRVAGGQVSASTMQVIKTLSGTYTSAVAATYAETLKWCIYSSIASNSTRFDIMSSGEFTWRIWNSGTSSASYAINGSTSSSNGTGIMTQANGMRMMPIPYNALLDAGLYVMAFAASTSTAGYSGLATRNGLIMDNPMPVGMGFGFGIATATSIGYGDAGTFSVTSAAMPASIGLSQIRQHSNLIPYFKIGAI